MHSLGLKPLAQTYGIASIMLFEELKSRLRSLAQSWG